jgi:hypothetical protein
VRDSAESFDPAYGRVRRAGRKRRPYFDDEATSAKRDRYRPRLATEDAEDATDGLPEGDRWSTWDQTENLISNAGVPMSLESLTPLSSAGRWGESWRHTGPRYFQGCPRDRRTAPIWRALP